MNPIAEEVIWYNQIGITAETTDTKGYNLPDYQHITSSHSEGGSRATGAPIERKVLLALPMDENTSFINVYGFLLLNQ